MLKIDTNTLFPLIAFSTQFRQIPSIFVWHNLAFDLEQRLFGGDSVSNGFIKQESGCASASSGYCGLYAPQLRLMPVARQSSEDTMVESYEMGGVSDEWKIRVDIYYNSSDSTKSILAADVFPIATASTNSSVAAGVYVYTVTESGGVTTFKDYQGGDQISAFTRGDSGTASLACPSGASLTGCSGTVTLSWSTRTVKRLVN